MCKNCGQESNIYYYDKVFRKMVCQSCKNKAIELGVRYEFDFEVLKKNN